MHNLNRFLERLEKAKNAVRDSGFKEAVILHHDEADGLTSAALAKVALASLGFEARLICLDKLYPEVVADIEKGPAKVIVYSDIGSAHIDWLSELNRGRNLVVTLDHHDTSESESSLVLNLNPELEGFSGESEASSSTVAYLFAKTVDANLRRFSHLGLIGSMEVPGEPRGLNEIVAKDAEASGSVKKSGRDYKISIGGTSLSRGRIVTALNVLGSVGYYQQGPSMGVAACVEGFKGGVLAAASRFEAMRKDANRKMLDRIRAEGLNQRDKVQWFHAGDNYSGMSGKVVGSFCSYLRFQRPVNPVKYLIGMMNVPAEVPGWGSLPAPLVKVSGRAPERLARLIEKGERPSLAKILGESCSEAGGFGDGHSVAASGVFPVGREEKFLEVLDRLAGS